MNADFRTAPVLSSFLDVIADQALRRPDKIAFQYVVDGLEVVERLTYSELDIRARAIAATLQRRFRAGDRVLVAFPSSLEFLCAFCGCIYAGMIAVPINIPGKRQSRADHAARVVQSAGCVCALTRADKLQEIEKWSHMLGAAEPMPVIATDMIPCADSESFERRPVDPETIAFLQYTSGSTGAPKGVVITHKNLSHNLELMRRAFLHDDATRLVSWLPVYHDMGLVASMLETVYVGADLILMAPATFLQNPLNWLAAISTFQATATFAPNFAYELCCDRISPEQVRQLDLSSLRLACNAAEPVRPSTLTRFTRHFEPAGFKSSAHCPAYGLAEATVWVSSAARGQEPKILYVDGAAIKSHDIKVEDKCATSIGVASVGPLNSDIEIRIVDPQTERPCPSNRVGEIWIKGGSVTSGYWEKTRLTQTHRSAIANEDVFFRTGDLGFVIDNELYVNGRIKDVIIVNGFNYYPQDIERVAQSAHAALSSGRGAAVSVDAPTGERLVIVQEIKRSSVAKANFEEILHAVSSVLAKHELPALSGLFLIPPMTLPMTTSGKVRRRSTRNALLNGSLATLYAWRLPALEGALGPNCAPSPRKPMGALPSRGLGGGPLNDWIIGWISENLQIRREDIDSHTAFAELGMDSVKSVEFATAMCEAFGTKFDPTLLWTAPPTIEALVAQMRKHDLV